MGTGTQLTSNEHLLQELEAISALGIALASARTDAEVLEVAGRTLPSFVDSMRVSVNLTTADGKHITIHPLFGPPDVVPTIVELENMLVEQAIQTRELIEVPDVGARSEPDAVWASGIGVRAVVVAPLVAAGECFGCINFSRSEPGHYRRHEIVLIRHIAATLAPAPSTMLGRLGLVAPPGYELGACVGVIQEIGRKHDVEGPQHPHMPRIPHEVLNPRVWSGMSGLGQRDHLGRDVNGDDLPRPPFAKVPGEVAVAAGELEDARSLDITQDLEEREDLAVDAHRHRGGILALVLPRDLVERIRSLRGCRQSSVSWSFHARL
ncbi:MAG: GAF domain-containing protein [Nannocystaceae bacterium]